MAEENDKLGPVQAQTTASVEAKQPTQESDTPVVQVAEIIGGATSVITPSDATTVRALRTPAIDIRRVTPSGCACEGSAKPTLVYVLGEPGYDFGTEARRDSFQSVMEKGLSPNDPQGLLTHLKEHPWDASGVIWTLNIDATPIYAIHPGGAFAANAYERLREFLNDKVTGNVDRVSIPGVIWGSATLFSGH